MLALALAWALAVRVEGQTFGVPDMGLVQPITLMRR
jgi:hypothetical protein